MCVFVMNVCTYRMCLNACVYVCANLLCARYIFNSSTSHFSYHPSGRSGDFSPFNRALQCPSKCQRPALAPTHPRHSAQLQQPWLLFVAPRKTASHASLSTPFPYAVNTVELSTTVTPRQIGVGLLASVASAVPRADANAPSAAAKSDSAAKATVAALQTSQLALLEDATTVTTEKAKPEVDLSAHTQDREKQDYAAPGAPLDLASAELPPHPRRSSSTTTTVLTSLVPRPPPPRRADETAQPRNRALRTPTFSQTIPLGGGVGGCETNCTAAGDAVVSEYLNSTGSTIAPAVSSLPPTPTVMGGISDSMANVAIAAHVDASVNAVNNNYLAMVSAGMEALQGDELGTLSSGAPSPNCKMKTTNIHLISPGTGMDAIRVALQPRTTPFAMVDSVSDGDNDTCPHVSVDGDITPIQYHPSAAAFLKKEHKWAESVSVKEKIRAAAVESVATHDQRAFDNFHASPVPSNNRTNGQQRTPASITIAFDELTAIASARDGAERFTSLPMLNHDANVVDTTATEVNSKRVGGFRMPADVTCTAAVHVRMPARERSTAQRPPPRAREDVAKLVVDARSSTTNASLRTGEDAAATFSTTTTITSTAAPRSEPILPVQINAETRTSRLLSSKPAVGGLSEDMTAKQIIDWGKSRGLLTSVEARNTAAHAGALSIELQQPLPLLVPHVQASNHSPDHFLSVLQNQIEAVNRKKKKRNKKKHKNVLYVRVTRSSSSCACVCFST